MSSKDLSEAIRRYRSNEENVRAATAENQHDFPYDRNDEAQVTRREFCNFLALTSTALFVGAAGFAAQSVVRGQPSTTEMKVTGAELLMPGSSLNFHYPTAQDPAILVRANDGRYVAYGQKCTHLSCPVYYEPMTARLECPCHNGAYEVHTGDVLFGPPPRPLDQVVLEVRNGGEVWAVGRKVGENEHVG